MTREEIIELLKENLSIKLKTNRDWLSGEHELTVTLLIDDVEISSNTVDLPHPETYER